MTVLNSGEIVHCPQCHTAQDEGQVDNYVVPGRAGASSRAEDTCHECDAPFSVMRREDGLFVVESEDY
jgi:hypothetical protein